MVVPPTSAEVGGTPVATGGDQTPEAVVALEEADEVRSYTVTPSTSVAVKFAVTHALISDVVEAPPLDRPIPLPPRK